MADDAEADDEPGLLERSKEWVLEHPHWVFVAFALPLTLGPVLVYGATQVLGDDGADGGDTEDVEVEVAEA